MFTFTPAFLQSTLKVRIDQAPEFLDWTGIGAMFGCTGPGALDRARLAEEILRSRLAQLDTRLDDLRFDYVGMNAVHREASPPVEAVPYEVALRVAGKGSERAEVEKISTAVAPMAVSGPAGTGKWGTLGDRVRPVIGMNSALIPRQSVQVDVQYFEA